jgi:DhnA family fructose-bisphosphate aldolase class Ia
MMVAGKRLLRRARWAQAFTPPVKFGPGADISFSSSVSPWSLGARTRVHLRRFSAKAFSTFSIWLVGILLLVVPVRLIVVVAHSLTTPAVILAADHRARGIVTVERYQDYVHALAAALPFCDAVMATAQPLRDLRDSGAIGASQRTYLSINRTGLAASSFELDDRLVASVGRATAEGYTGVKHMTRIDLSDPLTAPALELLGQVLEEAAAAGVEAMIEPLIWRDGHIARDTDSVVLAAVIAHDMGAPLLKVPVPDAEPGPARAAQVTRVVESVGAPVLFLGGPRETAERETILALVRDVMDGGGAGMAIGRSVYQDPDPATTAKAVAEIVHGC